LFGSIAVAYTAERPPEVEGPFLSEERQLIESLAEMLRTAYDRTQAEAALRDSEVRFRAMFDHAAIGISLLDEVLTAGQGLIMKPFTAGSLA
jgi:GAF domain-containing protein